MRGSFIAAVVFLAACLLAGTAWSQTRGLTIRLKASEAAGAAAKPAPTPSPAQLFVGVYPKAYNPGDVFKDCEACPEMVVVPTGTFTMGDLQGSGATDEKPVHTVTIARPFGVGTYEVTQGEWRALMGTNPSWFTGERNPVERVSWRDAKDFARELSARTGKAYRLLSEAEWEYMARAGSSTKYPWGNAISRSRARYGRANGTVPVGSYAPNAYGAYDTVGNVWEWVEDCWHDSYAGAPTDGSAWTTGGNCRQRVLRGGGWDYIPSSVRSANRGRNTTDNRNNINGFRVARTF